MDATDKQIQYIQLLSSRLGKEVPLHHLFGKTSIQASTIIERLKRQLKHRRLQREQKRKKEIRVAISNAASQVAEKKTIIREINRAKKARYAYTCRRCGSHTACSLGIDSSWEPKTIRVCAWCGNRSKDSVEWFGELDKRLSNQLHRKA